METIFTGDKNRLEQICRMKHEEKNHEKYEREIYSTAKTPKMCDDSAKREKRWQ